MKILIPFVALGLTSLVFAQSKITDYSVFSKTNIEYVRSDFEGLVGAGGNIYVEDFAFVSGRAHSGVLVGESFSHLRGSIDGNVEAGKSFILGSAEMFGKIIAPEVVLDYSSVKGQIRANSLGITRGYSGNRTSYYSSVRRMSNGESEQRYSKLRDQFQQLSIQLDDISEKCRDLESQRVKPLNGRLILKGAPGMNVFSVKGTDLRDVWQIELNIPSHSTAIINVSGESISLDKMNIKLNGTDPHKVLWNFYEAESLNIRYSGSSEIYHGRGVGMPGTFMAPYAHVTFQESLITGSLLVKSLSGVEPQLSGGQVNDALFNGQLCTETPPSHEGGNNGGKGERGGK